MHPSTAFPRPRRNLNRWSFRLGFLLAPAWALAADLPGADALRAVRVVSDVAYLGEGRAEKLDVYLPPGDAPAAPRPAVVYFHGGGWVKGDKADPREKNIGANLAAAGYVFVSANYILGEQAWPKNLHDCKNAVRYLRANAARYQVDPARIAVMGASAGGHLALMAAYTTGRAEFSPSAPYPEISDAVSAVIDFYGMTNLLTRQFAAPDGTPTGKLQDSHSPEVLGATRDQDPGRWKLASPVTHVAAGSPPTLIVHGLSDATVNYGQAIELANVLRGRGVPHELLLIEGVGHMFDLETWNGAPLPRDPRPALLDFLAAHLAAPAARR